VDEPADTELAAELDDRARAFDVHALVLRGGGVVRVERGQMEDRVAAVDRCS
jgi:hypothetical protein